MIYFVVDLLPDYPNKGLTISGAYDHRKRIDAWNLLILAGKERRARKALAANDPDYWRENVWK